MEALNICNDCGGNYSTQKKLKRHQRLQHSKKVMKCEDCGEEFEGPKKLENHKRNHVFKLCKYCENGFPYLSLKHHIKTCSSNSEKTEFSCDQCDYKTTLRMNLVRHKKAKHVQKV